MTRHATRRQPIINSIGTRRLAAQILSLRRRQPTLDDTVDAIREGDERVIHSLVVRAQQGDADATVIALWALLPRLAAVVINRLPIQEWHQGIDEYLTFAYLTIMDVDTEGPPLHLSDKIVSRTRRRYERAVGFEPVVLCGPGMLAAVGPADNDVEERVLAIINLDEVIRAVRGGLIEKRSWETLLRTRFGGEPGTASQRERKAASRAQRRLVEWSAEAA
jgi:hypothetical protein